MNKPVPNKTRHTPPPVSEEFLSGCALDGVDETIQLTPEVLAQQVTDRLLQSLKQRLGKIPPVKPEQPRSE